MLRDCKLIFYHTGLKRKLMTCCRWIHCKFDLSTWKSVLHVRWRLTNLIWLKPEFLTSILLDVKREKKWYRVINIFFCLHPTFSANCCMRSFLCKRTYFFTWRQKWLMLENQLKLVRAHYSYRISANNCRSNYSSFILD